MNSSDVIKLKAHKALNKKEIDMGSFYSNYWKPEKEDKDIFEEILQKGGENKDIFQMKRKDLM